MSLSHEFLAHCFGLEGRTAVVTGAGTGLGRQAALTLARAGAEVALLGRREAPLQETQALIAQAGGRSQVFPVDVTDRAAFEDTLERIEAGMAPLWVLVNNAGVGGRKPLAEVSEAQVDQLFAVNTKAALLAAVAFGRRLIARGSPGRVINICSVAAQTHSVGLGVYGASKAALEHLTRTLAREWATQGINVNSINPGFIETDINRAMLQSAPGRAMVQALPRQRAGTPDALDGALLLLAGPASDFISGSTLIVDDTQHLGPT